MSKKKEKKKLTMVKKYFLNEASFVDVGENGQIFNFYKRLDKGGVEKMANQESKENSVNTKPELEELTPRATDKSVSDWKAKNKKLEAELKASGKGESIGNIDKLSGTEKFQLAKDGLLPEDSSNPTESVTGPQCEIKPEGDSLTAKIEGLVQENQQMRYEALIRENEQLKRKVSNVRGYDRKPVDREQNLSTRQENQKPQKAAELSGGGVFDITDSLGDEIEAHVGVISG